MAAIAVSHAPHGSFLSLMSVGGIATPHHPHQNQTFVGLIDYLPANTQRSPGELRAPKGALQSWLSEQADLLVSGDAPDLERIFASYSLCDFGYDPMSIIRSIVVADGGGTKLLMLTGLVGMLEAGVRLVFPSVFLSGRILDSHFRNTPIERNVVTCIPIQNGAFNHAELVDGVPEFPMSLIGVIHRTLEEAGRTPKWSLQEGTYRSLTGPGDYLEVRL